MSGSLPTILIVDDISSFRAILRDMLEEIGFANIIEAADGGEAFQKLEANDSVALVVSDYNMSPRTGLDLLEAMKTTAKFAPIPFIMVSAINEQEVVSKATELGAVQYMYKPLDFGKFRNAVLDALRSQMT